MTTHAVRGFTHVFAAEQLKTLVYLRSLVQASSAIVAGGWVRDTISGHEPRDIDVFIASEQVEDVLVSLREDPALTITELYPHVHPVDLREDPAFTTRPVDFCESSGEHVENVWEIGGVQCLRLQIIEVEQPLAWVPLFDAHCNMLYVPLDDPRFGVVTASALAVAHAKTRVWEVNPFAQESRDVLMKRADKFEARGFEVRREPVESCP